jgi:hypothetical protein
MGKFLPGHPKYGGRKPGVQNKKIAARKMAEAEALLEAVKQISELPPLQLAELTPLNIMEYIMVARFQAGDHAGALSAAQSCAPYLHPRLTAGEVRVTHGYSNMSDEQLFREARALEGKMLTINAHTDDESDNQSTDDREALSAELAAEIS